MPTSYTDQFLTIDPYAPPPSGTAMTYSVRTLTDQNDDSDFDRFDNDNINGIDITASYAGDSVTLNVPGVGNVTYTGVTFYLADGSRVFTPNDGQVLQNGTLVSTTWVSGEGPLLASELGPPCFASGTMIETDRGAVAVERITEGDLVQTLDSGLQPVRWRGARTVSGLTDFAPIRFAPGAMNNHRAMLLSPNHRVLVTGWRAELLFGQDEVLVAAKHLVNGDTINRVPSRSVTYHHLMFDRHEVVFADGQASESLYPGDFIRSEHPEMHDEIAALFPELVGTPTQQWQTARYVLKRPEAEVLCSRQFSQPIRAAA